MREDSFTKFCISACIFMILFSLSMNVVAGLHVFGEYPTPMINETSDDATTIDIGGNPFNLESVMGGNIGLLLTGAGIGLVLVATKCLISGSYVLLAAYLFSIIFWGSWGSNVSILLSSGYFSSGTMLSIFGIITGVMVIIFLGAIIGILGGND